MLRRLRQFQYRLANHIIHRRFKRARRLIVRFVERIGVTPGFRTFAAGSRNIVRIDRVGDRPKHEPVIATLSVGRGPDDVGIDQATDQVIVANGGSNNVSVISDPLHGCRQP